VAGGTLAMATGEVVMANVTPSVAHAMTRAAPASLLPIPTRLAISSSVRAANSSPRQMSHRPVRHNAHQREPPDSGRYRAPRPNPTRRNSPIRTSLTSSRRATSREILKRAMWWAEPHWLFPNDAGRPQDKWVLGKAFRRTLKRAGLPAFRLYDLRHTYASLLLAAGAPITYVSAQLGHATPTTTLRVLREVDSQPGTAVGRGARPR
jgi:hypothetical protein